MKRWVLVVAALLAAGEERAGAEEGPGPGLVYAGLAVAGGINLTFTIVDLTAAARERRLSRLYGGLELAWGAYNVSLLNGVNPTVSPELTGWLVWCGALGVHGLWTLVRPEPPVVPVSARASPVELHFAPALLAGREGPAPGALLTGRF